MTYLMTEEEVKKLADILVDIELLIEKYTPQDIANAFFFWLGINLKDKSKKGIENAFKDYEFTVKTNMPTILNLEANLEVSK